MTQDEIQQLADDNAQELAKMHVPAGALVHQMLMELERDGRDTYIRLFDAVDGGHVVQFEFLEGDPTLVSRIGRALGFKTAVEPTLEVHSA